MNSVDELYEHSLESYIADSLIESYSNVAGFRLKECNFTANKFYINGLIYFNSGKTRETIYTFNEAFKDVTNNKIKLKGFNEKLGLDSQFIITGYTEKTNRTLITEAFDYSNK